MREIISEHAKLSTELPKRMNRDMIAAAVQKLQGHYWQAGMRAELALEVARDYIRLIDEACISPIAMQKAADSFLCDSEQRFMPKVGELVGRCKAIQVRLESQLEKITILIQKTRQANEKK